MPKMMLVAGLLALAGPAQAQTQPSSYASREVPLGTFDRLEVSGPFKVGVLVGVLVGGGPAKVDLQGPPALLADAIAEVRAGTLTIRFREGASWSWNPGSGVNIFVSAPKLVSARVSKAAQVEIGGVRGDTFSAATDGSATIALRGINAGRVQFASGGSGGITAEGIAQEGTYAVGGPGSIDAKRLRVQNASIAIGGAGSIHADVAGTATVSVGGTGRVDIVGGATCNKLPANSPRIECR